MKKGMLVAGKRCVFKFSVAVRTGNKKWDHKQSSKFAHVSYVQRELLSFVTACSTHLCSCASGLLFPYLFS